MLAACTNPHVVLLRSRARPALCRRRDEAGLGSISVAKRARAGWFGVSPAAICTSVHQVVKQGH